MVGEGFERNEALPQFFYRRKDKILIEVHMDDFHGEGPTKAATTCIERLRKVFDLKATDAFMTGRYAHLRRERLREPGSTLLRADPKHVEALIKLLSMENAKPVKTPSLMEADPGDESPELVTEDASEYRTGVGIMMYLAEDRWDIKRDTELLARRLHAPREFDRRRLIRVVKFLKGAPRWGHQLRIQGYAGKISIDAYSDTNYASEDDPSSHGER